LSLRAVTREIIQLVEDRSGIPTRVLEDPNIPTIATVRMARNGSSPVHLIQYKPYPGESPDYQICFQCGFILRLFSNPPEKRFDLADTAAGKDDVERFITAPAGIGTKLRLKMAQVEELRAQFLNGLLVHLRSVPIGLRVSAWLAANYPDLALLEKEHVQKEFEINRQSLAKEVKEITPPRIFRAAQSITAAYTLYWSEKFHQPGVFNIYRLEGFEKDAERLLEISDHTPDDPTYDRQLIDAWGKHLGITDWYIWLPYQPPN
jgi:hypothetical protein